MNDMEQMLIHRCKRGDLTAFEILISNYEKKTYNIAFGLVGKEEDAKDIAQDTFIKAFKSIATFKEKSSFSTWLYRITINTSKDYLRKRKNTIAFEDINAQGEIKDEGLQPQEQLEHMEERKLILSALKELKEEYSNVIILKDLNGFSYQEIADILDINLGTVKSRISRGRFQLRDILSQSSQKFTNN
jgi:RNA polymerase sigma-70 factor (ECF subfamily)